jgi:predicted acyltransferase
VHTLQQLLGGLFRGPPEDALTRWLEQKADLQGGDASAVAAVLRSQGVLAPSDMALLFAAELEQKALDGGLNTVQCRKLMAAFHAHIMTTPSP